jgi:hypothetical protein
MELSDDIRNRSAALLQQLLADPRTAPQAEELVAKINPTATFPMRDAREAVIAPVMGELEKERARVAALEAKWAAKEEAEAAAASRRAEDALMARLDRVKAKRGFSDEMMSNVMDRMREQNNPDVDAAAAWVAESIPKPAPATGHDFLPSGVDPLGLNANKDFFDGLMDTGPKGADLWLDKTLRSIASDPEFARLGGG